MGTGLSGIRGACVLSRVAGEPRSILAVVIILLQSLVDLFASEKARNHGNVALKRAEVSNTVIF